MIAVLTDLIFPLLLIAGLLGLAHTLLQDWWENR